MKKSVILIKKNLGFFDQGLRFVCKQNMNDTGVDPQTTVYFEIKKPPWVSVVWVVIACCICSKHDPCIYAARNAQPQRGKIFATQKSFDGASEASGVFYQQRNTFRRSERSERSLISNKHQGLTERAKRAEFFYLQ